MITRTLVVLVLVVGIQMTVDEDLKQKNIQELEKQKNELYKQINYAIDESVKSLLNANDTEATLGLEYMRDLKEHVKELNRTGNEQHNGTAIDVGSKLDLENRRRYKGLNYFKTRRPRNDPFDFEAALKPKRISEKEWMEMLGNRNTMQQKLDLWIEERRKDKERKKRLKMERKKWMMSGRYEKCPRFGYHGKKKKEKNRERRAYCKIRYNASVGKEYDKCIQLIPELLLEHSEDYSEEKKERKRSFSSQYKYPCCRKCCKKSYMGCL